MNCISFVNLQENASTRDGKASKTFSGFAAPISLQDRFRVTAAETPNAWNVNQD